MKTQILTALAGFLTVAGCASATSAPREGEKVERVTILRPAEELVVDTGGIPPDKQADILLVLQQRDSSARRCYQDVLNEKHTREFKGSVKVLLTVDTTGHASAVRIMGGTLQNKDVEDCIVATVKDFEFPKLERAGDIQYEYRFEPQY